MEVNPVNVKARLEAYCKQSGMKLVEPRLGWRQDGEVYSTNYRTAVKGYKYSELYRRELAIYERLQAWKVTRVEGFAVPSIIECNAQFAVLEMGIVKPPFVVDFVAAYLDMNSPFSPREMAAADRRAKSRFGEDWQQVQSLRAAFRKFGITLGDLKPENIRFR